MCGVQEVRHEFIFGHETILRVASRCMWGRLVMNHEMAVELHATERYLLGEFSAEEREAFEEHYFDCAICAEDVRAAAAFRANAKAVFRDDPVPLVARTEQRTGTERRNIWREFFTFRPAMISAAANAVLLIVLVAAVRHTEVLHRQIADAAAPHFYTQFGLAQSSRGDSEKELAPGDPFFAATIDLHPGQKFESFSYQIQNDSGAVVAKGSAPAPAGFTAETSSEHALAVPVSTLKSGRYLFVLSGVNHGQPTELSRIHLIER
jgi:hypothetical protein